MSSALQTTEKLIIDTNLLLLLIVGVTSRDYIRKHKRVDTFSESDFDLLHRIANDAKSVVVTPNILSETSNLAAQIRQPAKGEIARCMKDIIELHPEEYIESAKASKRPEFVRLGLVDTAILETCRQGATLLTTDLSLYLAAEHAGYEAINFNHLRDSN